MDGITGFKTATSEELPAAIAVMNPFHVVRLAGDALDGYRRPVQHELHGHRGRTGDPLHAAHRILLTDRQHDRLDTLFADDRHVEVEATWSLYQRMIAAYRQPDRRHGRELMSKLITSLSTGVPKPLTKLITLGHPLKQHATNVPAFSDHPHTSNAPHRSDL